MPADWPSPTPEDEVRARVRARTRTLRRRRSLPALALLAALPFALMSRPGADAPVRIATDGETTLTTEPPQGGAEQRTTPGAAVAPSDVQPVPPQSAASPVPEDTPGTRPDDPVTVADPFRGFPESPTFGTDHPILRDPEGDAWVQVEPSRAESDPTADITAVDIKANTKLLTIELRVLDLSRSPRQSIYYGRPRALEYGVALDRPEGRLYLAVRHQVDDGVTSTVGHYRTANAEAGQAGSYSSVEVQGVTGTLDVESGTARIVVTFDTVNRARAAKGHPAIGVGTTVVPLGAGSVIYGNGAFDSHATVDNVSSSDRDFAYRLGD